MKILEKHYVTFDSPGTLFSESSTKEIDSWDVNKAVQMSKDIVERYGARPYGFSFSTRLEPSKGVDDGRGGELKVLPKTIIRSRNYYLGGRILKYDDYVEANDDDQKILRSNMKCNRWWVVVENTNSYKSTRPFDQDDILLDDDGNIKAYGSDFESYRQKMDAWADVEQERLHRDWKAKEAANG